MFRLISSTSSSSRIKLAAPLADAPEVGEFVSYLLREGNRTHDVLYRVGSRRVTDERSADGDALVECEAHIVGHYDAQVGLSNPHQPPPAHASFERAPAGLLADLLFYKRPGQRGAVTIGSLLRRNEVQVSLDLDRLFSHHLAVLGSYKGDTQELAATLISSMLAEENQASVIVIDPRWELVNDLHRAVGDPLRVRRLEAGDFTIRFGELTMRDLLAILRPLNDEEEGILYRALEAAREVSRERDGAPDRWRLGDLLAALEQRGHHELASRLRDRLSDGGLFHDTRQSSLQELCQPGVCSVLEPDGPLDGQSVTLDVLLRRLEAAALPGPVMVVVNEAHLFIPLGIDAPAWERLAQLARSRQRKVGLCLVSAMPHWLNGDLLSELDTVLLTQMTGSLDHEQVTMFSSLPSDLAAALPHLPADTAIVAGHALRTPVIAHVPRRAARMNRLAGLPPEWVAGPNGAQ